MKTIAFVTYPGLTALDLVGPLTVLDPLSALLPDEFRTVLVGEHTGLVSSDTPLRIAASHTFDEVPEPFAVVVPGGLEPTIEAMSDERLLAYLRRAGETAEVLASVCTGSLVLAAAGLLEGREATTHWAFLDLLEKFGAKPVAKRWVSDGKAFTAAGVAAGIDAALHLAATLAGEDVARTIQFGIEYDPRPPFGPLNWEDAPREMWQALRADALREGTAEAPDLARKLGVAAS